VWIKAQRTDGGKQYVQELLNASGESYIFGVQGNRGEVV